MSIANSLFKTELFKALKREGSRNALFPALLLLLGVFVVSSQSWIKRQLYLENHFERLIFPEDQEMWLGIDGYEGYYRVSNLGRVKSLPRKMVAKTRYVGSDDGDGYIVARLRKDGKRTKFFVHTLVLEVFDRKALPDEECRHLDGNRQNNHINNLKWGTHKENGKDMIRHGRSNKGSRNLGSKLKEGEVLLIKKILKANIVSQRFIAKMFKMSQPAINEINTGKSWDCI